MAQISKIQWTDATWNPARGCSKVDDDCKYCYMYRQSLDGTRYEPKQVTRTKTVFNLPLTLKEPSRIFTASLTDVFHEDIDSYRNEIWDIIRRCPQHTFQILTKRPERIQNHLPHDWGEGWDNVWLGTSVGSQKGRDRIIYLLDAPAKTRFLSAEPLHGELDLENLMEYIPNYASVRTNALSGRVSEWNSQPRHGEPYDLGSEIKNKLDWVIVGGESGNDNGKYRYRECKIEWIEKIAAQCKKAGVSLFVKQLGTYLSKQYKLKDRHAGDMDEWPTELSHLKVREFPADIKKLVEY